MAKFELELAIREKRRLMNILNTTRSEYLQSLRAAERGEVAFESDERIEFLVNETTKAVEVISSVIDQLHDQNPN